ncbi:HNH endonuclease [Stenotrophomonas sp. GD03657]|uniref:HNH endonuclease n=1 Tax=Stenotrophomonas sp. GD03657 TaxID=2975363 RepID=UPI0024479327|nr:HNH endonuclease [Stenotrophomonas sp. GD03657]MDH2154339.1 HNH endonuclease [Stenotrophomonas sp. GD03657]
MNQEEFRVIPGYENYGVTSTGAIKSFERDLVLKQYRLDGYAIVDTFRGSLTETLPVHRAVALAWIPNPDPTSSIVVNHKDGNRLNNDWNNLEWTTYSGNNYHAVNTGLRSDNIPCRVREFQTGLVHEFSSMAQAAKFMGLTKDAPIAQLQLKKFGSLIKDRFEFRFDDDPTPWFYESRSELVPPSRYMVRVRESNGDSREIYSNRNMLKDYQLYDSPYGKSIPGLAKYANEKYPDKSFEVRDSYSEAQRRTTRATKLSQRTRVKARYDGDVMWFESLTKAAHHFDVDRSCIVSRIESGEDLDGWTFTTLPS